MTGMRRLVRSPRCLVSVFEPDSTHAVAPSHCRCRKLPSDSHESSRSSSRPRRSPYGGFTTTVDGRSGHEVARVRHLERDEVRDARGLRAQARERERAGVVVAAHQREVERRLDAVRGLGLQRVPHVHVVVEPALEREASAEARRAVRGQPRRLDEEGAGAAHGIDERRGEIPVGQQEQAGGGRLVERALHLDRPPAALVQALAGQVAVQEHAVPLDDELERHVGILRVDARTAPGPGAHVIDDGVLDPQRGVAGVADPLRVAHRRRHGQRLVGRDPVRPVERGRGVVHVVGVAHLGGEQLLLHADRGAQPQVGRVREPPVAAERDPAAPHLDVPRAEGEDLPLERGLQALAAGGEQLAQIHA